MKKAKHWYDYLWVYAILYFTLGFFNILFAWLGMIDFLLPLILAISLRVLRPCGKPLSCSGPSVCRGAGPTPPER